MPRTTTMASSAHLAVAVLILLTPIATCCNVSPPMVECNWIHGCTIYNYQGRWDGEVDCSSSAAFYPPTEQQLIATVAAVVKANRTINVVTSLIHSISPLMCVGSGGVVISTRCLSWYSRVDPVAQTITVDAGMHMRDVLDQAAKWGLTLYDAVTWDGVTAAGSISTGAHGSGQRGLGSGIYEYVTALRLVVPATSSEGYAKVIDLTEKDGELKAARFSLGALGVISRVTFKLEPMFKRSATGSVVLDEHLEDFFLDFLNMSDFAFIDWHVGIRKVRLWNVERVSAKVSGDGIYRIPLYQPVQVQASVTRTEAYKQMQAEQNVKQLCMTSEAVIRGPTTGYYNKGYNFTGYPVVGFNHKMAASGGCENYHMPVETDPDCLPHTILNGNESVCLWDRRIRQVSMFDVETRVPLSRARQAILDIKRLRDASPPGVFCGLVDNAIFMRTITKSQNAYLGPREDSLTFEFFEYRSPGTYSPTPNMDVFQEMEQMLIEKHGGHLHWGKSGGYLFEGQAQHKIADFKGFMKVKKKLDPKGVFSNDWIERLFGIGTKKVERKGKGCGIEKTCKCSKDSHCAPALGYFCRPGRVWSHARVCRKGNSTPFKKNHFLV